MGSKTSTAAGAGFATVSASMKPGRRDGAWLAMAVMLHALLLLIPLQRSPSPTEGSRSISVSLLAPRKEQAIFEQSDLPAPGPEKLRPADRVPPLLELPLAGREAQPAIVAREVNPEDPPAEITTARLIDSASRFKWPSMEKDQHRQLGVFEPQAIPDNWRPLITIEENRFRDLFVPVKTEIVDRWLAADGTHNVVVNTPSGDTLCGRAKPWDPINPLLEPVMTFWKCGGGGKRAFKIPERYMRSRQQPR